MSPSLSNAHNLLFAPGKRWRSVLGIGVPPVAVNRAQRIVAADAAAKEPTVQFDGRVDDTPVALQAMRTLARAANRGGAR